MSNNSNHHVNEETSHTVGFLAQHRFLLLVAGSTVIAVLLVMISFTLYVSSGTAQLDLSRPGYAELRQQVTRDNNFEGFRANGELDAKALDAFNALYSERVNAAESVDAFGGDVLSPEALQITPSQ